MVKANRVKAWREAARAAVPEGLSFDVPVRIEAHIWKPRRGRYDPNNLAGTTKSCVDGFVSAGLLKDDDWNHVIGPDHRHGGIGAAGILFLITELLEITVLTQ
jgi:crossover junction endodeoxyribonuclease RusA